MADTPDIDVAHVGRLARLAVAPDEAATLSRQLGAVLAYVDQLAELDLTDVPPTTHAVPLDLALRDDVEGPHLSTSEALANAPRHDGRAFVVPRVV